MGARKLRFDRMEQVELNKKKREELESQLYSDALSISPKFASNEAAIAALSRELEELTTGLGKSASEIMRIRETSSQFNEAHERIATIVRQISLLKK